MAFTLNLYPSSTDTELRSSRERVVREAREFAQQYRSAHPTLSADEEFWLENLEHHKYWHVLSMIDGHADRETNEPALTREGRRSWARERFNQSQLQRILDIAVNIALLVPDETPNYSGPPGFYLGYSTLYEQFVKNSGSMFAEATTPNFERRLQNGRFWESVPNLAPSIGHAAFPVANDTLTNHFEKLDVSFAPEGIKLARRMLLQPASRLDICYLSDEAVKRYGEFFERVHHEVGEKPFQHEELAILVAPFILEMVAIKGHPEDNPRFLESPEQLRAFFAGDFPKHYATSSAHVKDRLADCIEIAWSTNLDHIDHYTDVFLALPDKTDVGKRIFACKDPRKSQTEQDHDIVNIIERLGLDYERAVRKYLDEETNDRIMYAKNRIHIAAQEARRAKRKR